MNSKAIQPMLVEAALGLLPPDIRRALINDRSFCDRWDVSTVISVTLGKNGPSFRRDRLYEGMRNAILNRGSAVAIQDQSDTAWEVLAQPQGETLAFSIWAGDARYFVIDHSALAEDVVIRVGWFEKVAKEINFEGISYKNWLDRLSGMPLSDDEFGELMADIEQTPVKIYRTMRANFERTNVDVATLVPQELRYYERLVGRLGSVTTVAEYIETGAKPLIADLQRWEGSQGFLDALLVCSAGLIAEGIRIEGFGCKDLTQAYQWLAKYGDPISRIGAVEVALFHLDTHPELAPFIEQIVDGFVADEPGNDSGGFALLGAMVVMVVSELTRRRMLVNAPPFYRKQAAIAQASLIVRAINESSIDPASITQWIQSSGLGHIFFLQGLVDLRQEPLWLPDFVSAKQLRAEFIGRIMNAVHRSEAKVQTKSLQTFLLGVGSKLAGAACWPFPNLPGPLEGAITPRQPISDEVLAAVRAALEADRLEVNSFTPLINAALLFDLQESESSLAASALRRVNFSIENANDEATTFSLLNGLAIVAAVTRSRDLADTLRVLVRALRRRKRLVVDPDNEWHVVLIAAASFEGIEDWARFAGEWITEIAFAVNDKDAAKNFLPVLRRLVQIEPVLARHCAMADAVLSTFVH